MKCSIFKHLCFLFVLHSYVVFFKCWHFEVLKFWNIEIFKFWNVECVILIFFDLFLILKLLMFYLFFLNVECFVFWFVNFWKLFCLEFWNFEIWDFEMLKFWNSHFCLILKFYNFDLLCVLLLCWNVDMFSVCNFWTISFFDLLNL